MNGVSYVASLFGPIMESTKSVIRRHVLNPVLDKSCSGNLADRRIAKIAITIFTLVSFGQFSSYKESYFKFKIKDAAQKDNFFLMKKYLPAYSGNFEPWIDETVSSPLYYAVAKCEPDTVKDLLERNCSTLEISKCLENFFKNILQSVYTNEYHTSPDDTDLNLNKVNFLKILPLLLAKTSKTSFNFDVCFLQIERIVIKDENFAQKIIELLLENGARTKSESVFEEGGFCLNSYRQSLIYYDFCNSRQMRAGV